MKQLAKAPAAKLTLACACGIILAETSSPLWGCLLPIAILALSWVLYRDRQHLGHRAEQLTSLFILLGMLGLGAWRHQVAQPLPRAGMDLETVNCQEVVLLGQLLKPVKTNAFGRKAQVEAIAVQQDSQWAAVRGQVMLYLPDHIRHSLRPDDTLCTRVKLNTLYSRFPDYLAYLNKQGVWHAGWVQALQVGGRPWSIRSLAYDWQQRAAANLRAVIHDPDVHGLAEAMFLGEKRHLQQTQREAFAAAGASHVLAISGLHVGLIFALLQWLLTPLLQLPQGERLRSSIILLALLLYMLVTGAAPAVSRATLMIGLFLMVRMAYRRIDRLNLVATAALIQLIVDPLLLFEVGFQLSYAAVIGIVLMLPQVERHFQAQRNWLRKLHSIIGVSLVATLATAPLVIYYFEQFPTYFLLANLLISLFVSALVMVGFVTVLCAGLPGIGALLGDLSTSLLQLLDGLCREISSLPYAVIQDVSWDEKGIPILLLQLLIAVLLLAGPRCWRWYQQQRIRGRALPVSSPS